MFILNDNIRVHGIKILRIFLVVVMCFGGFRVASAVDDIEMLNKAIQTTTDKKEQGILYKKVGDYYVSIEDFKRASDAYANALSLSRDSFSQDERADIAVYLSWGGKLKESEKELRLIISENPSHVKARLHLAKVLSWEGNFDEAIKEADKFLSEFPGNKEALLVKAHSLRWKNSFGKALPIYKHVLEEGEDFDARLGQSYAYLSAGNIKAAREGTKLLKPEYPYQEKELKEFIRVMDRTTRPRFDIRYSYYTDSDDNIVNRYSIDYGFWAGNWKNNIQYRHTDAKDNTRDARAEDIYLKTYSKVTESIGVGGGLGLSQVGNGDSTNYGTWSLRTDIDAANGIIGVSIAQEVFSEIAQLIENRIRVTNTGLYISQNLTDRLSTYVSYNYKDYSDNNNAHDVQIIPKYVINVKNPRITLGYRIRYLDFNRQSGSGYFDPDDFISHQIFSSLYFENEKLYSYIEPFIGYQSFKRSGEKSSDFISGAYGTIGFNLVKNMVFEINAEGGNYALETATGFRYYLIGLRVVCPL